MKSKILLSIALLSALETGAVEAKGPGIAVAANMRQSPQDKELNELDLVIQNLEQRDKTFSVDFAKARAIRCGRFSVVMAGSAGRRFTQTYGDLPANQWGIRTASFRANGLTEKCTLEVDVEAFESEPMRSSKTGRTYMRPKDKEYVTVSIDSGEGAAAPIIVFQKAEKSPVAIAFRVEQGKGHASGYYYSLLLANKSAVAIDSIATVKQVKCSSKNGERLLAETSNSPPVEFHLKAGSWMAATKWVASTNFIESSEAVCRALVEIEIDKKRRLISIESPLGSYVAVGRQR